MGSGVHLWGAPAPPPFRPSRAVCDVTFKAFPCSRACHPALTALASLTVPPAASIRSVQIRSYPFSVELDQRSGPATTPIAAQMSLRKTVALALLHGGLGDDFRYTREKLADPRLEELSSRIRVEVHPRFSATGPRVRGASVRIVTDDGSVEEAEVDEPRWGPSRPASDEELRERFLRFTAGRPAIDLWEKPEQEPMRRLFS